MWEAVIPSAMPGRPGQTPAMDRGQCDEGVVGAGDAGVEGAQGGRHAGSSLLESPFPAESPETEQLVWPFPAGSACAVAQSAAAPASTLNPAFAEGVRGASSPRNFAAVVDAKTSERASDMAQACD